MSDGVGEMDGDTRFEFVTAADHDPPWRVRSMQLEEHLSEPYVCRITLAVHQDEWTAPKLLGKSATLRWDRLGGTERSLHGILEWVHPHGLDGEEILTEVRLAPALKALQHRSDSRVFEGKTAVEVALKVLEEDLAPFSRTVQPKLDPKAYPVREYVVQHRESNLDFVQRLLAEEGVWFYFVHPATALASEELVLCDANADGLKFERDALVLADMVQHQLKHEAVIALSGADQLRPTKVAVRQFNWGNPDVPDEAEGADDEGEVELSLYDPDDVGVEDGGGKPTHTPAKQATRRLEARALDKNLVHMTTLYAGLQGGMIVTIDSHDEAAFNQDYLLIDAQHSFEAQRSGRRTGFVGQYQNRVVALPNTRAYRPTRLDKPRIHGLQTATVVGPDRATAFLSDVHTDDHGRIRVKFSWDRTSPSAEGTVSCWTRVAQMWGGPGWGSQFIPRIGMEVVVSFVDGDPDRPLVVGSVYNGRNPIAHTDPTHSGLRSASIGGVGFNEFRFEDAAGSERIYVHAQHDLVEEVLHDHNTEVKGKQSNTVKKSQSESVGGSQSLSVGGDRSKTVKGAETNTIEKERTTTVTKKVTDTFKDEYAVDVTLAVTETYQDKHNRYVTGDQTLECEANRIEHIAGNYELTTDLKFNLTQNGTSLTFEGDKVALDAAGAISVKRGPATVDIDDGGNVVIATPAGISFECGGSKIILSPSGVEIEAMQISLTAGPSSVALTPASAEMKSVNTTVEATAVCAVKGTAMVALN